MSNFKLLIRAHQTKSFCTSGRTKDEEFGETAISLIHDIALFDLYRLKKHVSTKEMEKGILLEPDAIEMMNRVYFRSYTKNTVRKTEHGFTGECDIDSEPESLVRDMKNAWSADTFSWTREQLEKKAKKSGYDLQLRTYMMLYNRDGSRLDEVLLSTPFDLIPPYEDPDFHEVDHIAEAKRITTIEDTRDKLWEEWLLERHYKAEKIYQSFIEEIQNK